MRKESPGGAHSRPGAAIPGGVIEKSGEPKSLSTDSTRCVVQQPANARQWSEELALDGGVANLSGPWTWCARELNIGAAVIGRK